MNAASPAGDFYRCSRLNDARMGAQSGGGMLAWSDAMGYGAFGGLIAEGAILWGRVRQWQDARHAALLADGDQLPKLRKFIDLTPDMVAMVGHAVLGCAAGWLLHSQISGTYAAVAAGAAAPALLTNFAQASARSNFAERIPEDSPTTKALQSAPVAAPVPTEGVE